MPNHLINETSPYLLQHAHNPVNWYPWGEEALQLAQQEDKPIFLSIGYAACHWCHVMAHESFEDQTTADYLNTHFISIKVDREERPDIDGIYMTAVVAITGHGGWPMTVFLTPDGRPFYGGTYYPLTPRYGMPSFRQILGSILNAWKMRRNEIEKSAGEIAQHLSRALALTTQSNPLDDQLFFNALSNLLNSFDSLKGGFGRAPKFPPAMTLEFLLRVYLQRNDPMALHMAEHTLKMMAYGGLYDQLGGGFARYSTDNDWLVPHFEKMLYDNALLARVYLHAWQVTGKPLYRRIVEETLDWVVRELRHEAGGFYSSYDADSEGEEGKFYVWSASDIRQVLGREVDVFMSYYGIKENGNWEGHNILHLPRDPEETAKLVNLPLAEVEQIVAAAKKKLFAVRAGRAWPGLDDKVLTAWNGLMLAAFAEAGQLLQRPDYTQVAIQNAEFLYQTMRQANGRLYRTWKAGTTARYNAYLEDYAYLADGLLALYQNSFDERWFAWAQELTEKMMTHFADETQGGFFDTSNDHEQLIHRPKDVQDNATPSANAMAAQVLLKVSLYTGNGRYWDWAESATAALYEAMSRYPNGFAHWLCAAMFILGEPKEVAIVGKLETAETQTLLHTVTQKYRPNLVLAVGLPHSHIPLLTERPMLSNRSTAYVCHRFVCRHPVNDAEDLLEQLS